MAGRKSKLPCRVLRSHLLRLICKHWQYETFFCVPGKYAQRLCNRRARPVQCILYTMYRNALGFMLTQRCKLYFFPVVQIVHRSHLCECVKQVQRSLHANLVLRTRISSLEYWVCPPSPATQQQVALTSGRRTQRPQRSHFLELKGH